MILKGLLEPNGEKSYNYFKNYIKAENQIINIKAPEYINNIPNREEINQLLEKVSQKDIEPYQFTLKEVELIQDELIGSKISKMDNTINKKKNKLTIDLYNDTEIILKQTDFKKDQIKFSAFSSGGYSTASFDKLASAKYTEDILSRADMGDLSVTEKANLYSEDAVDVVPYITEDSEGMDGYSNNKNLETMFKLMYLNFTDLRIKQSHVDRFKESKINEYKIDKQTGANIKLQEMLSMLNGWKKKLQKPTLN